MENKSTITIELTGDTVEGFKEAVKKIEKALEQDGHPYTGFNENDESSYKYTITSSRSYTS